LQHGSGVRNSGQKSIWETGQRIVAHQRRPKTARHKVPSNAFQIAAPGPIQRRIGYCNMGPVSDRRKRINAALLRPQPGPNPVRQSRQG